ncbi:MAG: LTA synthase family protein, partial [Bacilli bacterium]|nr:LTA synthase family protein [Bacilli bacterium]
MIFATSVYTCVQLGFYNFLGVYASFQTSSQLGAVKDYIKDFLRSFKWQYFLTLIPFVLVILFFVIFSKKLNKENIKIKNSAIVSCSIVVLSVILYATTILAPGLQNKNQIISNEKLFLTASNPSLAVEQYGTLGFCFLDVKAMLFPVTIEENYGVIDQELSTPKNETEYSRNIDDAIWIEIIEEEKNEKLNDLNKYFISRNITEKNEYTGLFENKNLIVIMMESVNDIFLNPEYYPNFNKLVSEGWYWENNYSPRNSCSTMNNEFSGMTSLYSIYNTCTASKYKTNTYYESIFNLFKQNNYVTFSAHDYTEAYYPRKTIHTNMGSDEYFGVEKLGIDYSNMYINWANDDEFMTEVLNIIDNKTANNEQFMTWLTTVSSHQPYGVDSIQGNAYYDLTEETGYPKDVRRYMSKLKILDNGLGILLEGLEERGILDDTVIVLYGDHYPYGISTDNLNKVLDYDTAEYYNTERVPFVIYNSEIEGKVFTEYTSFINILPTLANLFNMDYDPRLYLGTDLLSKDYKSLVVFADGSWKNEKYYYDASKSKIENFTSEELSLEELQAINNDINIKITVSNDVIKNNYFAYLE